MQQIEVKTGFGYYKDSQQHIVSKAELPPGKHILQDGLLYIEVNNRDEIDAVEIYTDPTEIKKQQDLKMIQEKTREIAIEELKQEGKLPPDFVDPLL